MSWKEVVPVIPELFDGILDICEGPVIVGSFGKGLGFRKPASDQHLDGADINMPVMEVAVKLRHMFGQKTAIMVDRASA